MTIAAHCGEICTTERKGGRERTLDKLLDALAVLGRLALPDQIHLVLQNDNVVLVDANNFQRGQVLAGLRLRAGLVTGNQQERAVHWTSASSFYVR